MKRHSVETLLRQAEQLDATHLDALIRKLALLRAGLAPEVPQSPDLLEKQNAAVLVEDKPALVISARREGGFRLWLRHRGLNWLAFQIDDATAARMSNFVRKHIGDGPGIDLISQELGNRH